VTTALSKIKFDGDIEVLKENIYRIYKDIQWKDIKGYATGCKWKNITYLSADDDKILKQMYKDAGITTDIYETSLWDFGDISVIKPHNDKKEWFWGGDKKSNFVMIPITGVITLGITNPKKTITIKPGDVGYLDIIGYEHFANVCLPAMMMYMQIGV
jgi:hypothetical protein